MRVTNQQSFLPPTETRKSTHQTASRNAFADALDSATASDDGGRGKPELSAATYRLFASVAVERGDTVHANLFRARAAAATEAGIPLQPSGFLSENGRWDYTEAASKIPETGHFDTATGQGMRSFVPYKNGAKTAATTTAIAQAATDATTTARARSGSDPMRFITKRHYGV